MLILWFGNVGNFQI